MAELQKLSDLSLFPAPEAGKGFSITPLTAFFVTHAPRSLAPHQHDYYQVIFFEEGSGEHEVEFHCYTVQRNSLFCTGPFQEHRFDHTAYKGIIMRFNGEMLDAAEDGDNLNFSASIFDALNPRPCIVVPQASLDTLRFLLNELSREFMAEDSAERTSCLESLLRIFLIRLKRLWRGDSSGELTRMSSTERTFLKYRRAVEMHFKSLHLVGAYAALLNIPMRSLTHAVTTCALTSPLALINRRLIIEAKRDLWLTDRKVKEIAHDLGFKDPSYFVKFFKFHTEEQPLEFRARARRFTQGKAA